MSKEEVIHAYRHLYRAALLAVCHSKPASFQARDQLRRAFRKKGATFDGSAIRRTVWFLHNAARERGMEHQIVRNLLLTKYWRDDNNKPASWKTIVEGADKKKKDDLITNTAYAHYEQTITMLNKTMGICLPLR